MFLYNYENLKRITQTENGKKLISEVENVYNSLFKDKPIPVTNYSYQKLIYKTGNRDLFQRIYYDRRKRFSCLQLLALANDDYLEELENICEIDADIVLEKASHKQIVIGKNGTMLKNIGIKSRQDIEKLVGNKVMLKLFVKVREDWRSNSNAIKSLGYNSNDL